MRFRRLDLCSLQRSSTLNSVADALMLGLAVYAYVACMIAVFGIWKFLCSFVCAFYVGSFLFLRN